MMGFVFGGPIYTFLGTILLTFGSLERESRELRVRAQERELEGDFDLEAPIFHSFHHWSLVSLFCFDFHPFLPFYHRFS